MKLGGFLAEDVLTDSRQYPGPWWVLWAHVDIIARDVEAATGETIGRRGTLTGSTLTEAIVSGFAWDGRPSAEANRALRWELELEEVPGVE